MIITLKIRRKQNETDALGPSVIMLWMINENLKYAGTLPNP